MIKKTNSLILSNGHRWSFYSSDDSHTISEQISAIMELDSSIEADNRLIYLRNILNNDMSRLHISDDAEKYHADGWSSKVIGRTIFWTHQNINDIICIIGPQADPVGEALKIGDSLFSIYERETNYGGLPVHSALIERDGNGVLLAARGETGKSTCCQRLKEPWHSLCDDEALIVKSGSSYNAHPFPTWSNFVFKRSKQSWNVQRYVPLKAIYFLEQADHDEAIPIGYGEAASLLYYSSIQSYYRMMISIDKNYKKYLKNLIFNNACEMCKCIPAFRLKTYLHGTFWDEIDISLANLH